MLPVVMTSVSALRTTSIDIEKDKADEAGTWVKANEGRSTEHAPISRKPILSLKTFPWLGRGATARSGSDLAELDAQPVHCDRHPGC